jgi:hypothetical protein
MISEVVLPILVGLLLLGSVAKVGTAGTESEPGALTRLGPAVLVPEPYQRIAMIGCAVGELILATALLIVDHPFFRWGAVGFFAVSAYVLVDLRRRRPDVGCGCFGEVSATPVGLRSIGRTLVLTGWAVVLALDPVTLSTWLDGLSWTVAAWTLGGIGLLAALSPELEEAVARLRYRAPCEQRPYPADRALSRLRSSTAWRAHASMILSAEPTDMWRELCWRFFVYRGHGNTEVVFAVYLSGRRPPVKAAVVAADGQPLVESVPVSAGA